MYFNKEKVSEVNFLASARFQSFTYQATQAMVPGEDKVLPAGSVFPKNDATAIGITIHDVDLSKGDQPVGVIVEGYILEDRLPVKPDALAKPEMKEIKFR